MAQEASSTSIILPVPEEAIRIASTPPNQNNPLAVVMQAIYISYLTDPVGTLLELSSSRVQGLTRDRETDSRIQAQVFPPALIIVSRVQALLRNSLSHEDFRHLREPELLHPVSIEGMTPAFNDFVQAIVSAGLAEHLQKYKEIHQPGEIMIETLKRLVQAQHLTEGRVFQTDLVLYIGYLFIAVAELQAAQILTFNKWAGNQSDKVSAAMEKFRDIFSHIVVPVMKGDPRTLDVKLLFEPEGPLENILTLNAANMLYVIREDTEPARIARLFLILKGLSLDKVITKDKLLSTLDRTKIRSAVGNANNSAFFRRNGIRLVQTQEGYKLVRTSTRVLK